MFRYAMKIKLRYILRLDVQTHFTDLDFTDLDQTFRYIESW